MSDWSTTHWRPGMTLNKGWTQPIDEHNESKQNEKKPDFAFSTMSALKTRMVSIQSVDVASSSGERDALIFFEELSVALFADLFGAICLLLNAIPNKITIQK